MSTQVLAMEAAVSSCSTSHTSPICIDPYDLALQRSYIQQQCAVLRSRHPVNSVFLAHALAQYHADSVVRAKKGGLSEAEAQLRALSTIELPDNQEIKAVVATTALPAMALVHWMQGRSSEAIGGLSDALYACSLLARQFRHGYLTPKRIHLAANIARVLTSINRQPEAIAHVDALRSVMSGRREAWAYPGPETLCFPMSQTENRGLVSQLSRIESLARDGVRNG